MRCLSSYVLLPVRCIVRLQGESNQLVAVANAAGDTTRQEEGDTLLKLYSEVVRRQTTPTLSSLQHVKEVQLSVALTLEDSESTYGGFGLDIATAAVVRAKEICKDGAIAVLVGSQRGAHNLLWHGGVACGVRPHVR